MKLSKTIYLKNNIRIIQTASMRILSARLQIYEFFIIRQNNLNNCNNIIIPCYREVLLSLGEIEAQFYLSGLVEQLGQRVVERHDGRGVLAQGRVMLH